MLLANIVNRSTASMATNRITPPPPFFRPFHDNRKPYPKVDRRRANKGAVVGAALEVPDAPHNAVALSDRLPKVKPEPNARRKLCTKGEEGGQTD